MTFNRQAVRQSIRSQRRALSTAEQQSAANDLATLLTSSAIFLASRHIAIYSSFDHELDTQPLLQRIWQLNKICYLPILNPDQSLSFISYSSDDELILNHFNIFEPKYNQKKLITPAEIDLVLVPLVAFDNNGNRLGMGAGYYDRTFAFLNMVPRPAKPFLLGVAYDWQRVAEIPSETWDVKLNAVLTNKELILCPTG